MPALYDQIALSLSEQNGILNGIAGSVSGITIASGYFERDI
jgi:hypothetical protein